MLVSKFVCKQIIALKKAELNSIQVMKVYRKTNHEMFKGDCHNRK